MIIEDKQLVEVNEVIKLFHNRATEEDMEALLDGLRKMDWYEYKKTDHGYILKPFGTKEDTK